MVKHPAKYSEPIKDAIRVALPALLSKGSTILDPFAGVQGVHWLRPDYRTFAVEIEPEWAKEADRYCAPTLCADFLKLNRHDNPGWFNAFDAVITSPTYGNRMADHHNPRDGSRRISYKFYLGRDLSEGNSGAMQWGKEYKAFHILAWNRVHQVLDRTGPGLFLLNVSDHIRKGEVVPVVEWHKRAVQRRGFRLLFDREIETQRMRHGENHQARVSCEHLLAFKKVTSCHMQHRTNTNSTSRPIATSQRSGASPRSD